MITVNPAVAPDAVQAFLKAVRPAIDAHIARCLDGGDADDPGRLREAMRYAALGPGKRLRPALAVAACLAAGGSRADAMPAAAAVEMLHAYTLIHDDLPALDDDELRRGRPTVHIAFGEAIAILAGDGLLTAAFGALAELGDGAAAAVRILAQRAGANELIRGQAMDIALSADDAEPAHSNPSIEVPIGGPNSGVSVSLKALEAIHRAKTGALFAAAAELGGVAAFADRAARRALARYGMNIGIAFQYADDRDDEEHVKLRAQARTRMLQLTDEALHIADDFGESGRELRAIAEWIAGVA